MKELAIVLSIVAALVGGGVYLVSGLGTPACPKCGHRMHAFEVNAASGASAPPMFFCPDCGESLSPPKP